MELIYVLLGWVFQLFSGTIELEIIFKKLYLGPMVLMQQWVLGGKFKQ